MKEFKATGFARPGGQMMSTDYALAREVSDSAPADCPPFMRGRIWFRA
jgi:hypothetical protein